MKSIIARALLVVTFVAFAAPAAHAQSYPKPVVMNRTQYDGSVTVNYMSCRADTFRIGRAPTKSQTGINQSSATSSSNRGLCLITSVDVTLDGATKRIKNYTSSGTSYSHFYIIEQGNDVIVLSEAQMKRLGLRVS